MVCPIHSDSLTVAANIVLEDTVERIFVGNKYCEKPLGIFIIRGENVVLLSEIVCGGLIFTNDKGPLKRGLSSK